MGPTYSDYIIYVDESGDHGLQSINREYPLFVLSFCIFDKSIYADIMTPEIRKLKFGYFGHDMVVLHEHDIRKKRGPFSRLAKEAREKFMEELANIIERCDFTLVAVVIDKQKLNNQYTSPTNPYHLAMEYGLERVYRFLKGEEQSDHCMYLVVEARGKKEDDELELEFRRVCDGENYFSKRLPFELIIADKKVNSEGLQLADMTARPIGLSVLRPDQTNRAMAIIKNKYYKVNGNINGFGLKIFP